MLRVKTIANSEAPYIYKFELEWFGKSLGHGISKRELSSWKDKSRRIVISTRNYYRSIRSIIRGEIVFYDSVDEIARE